MQRLLRVILKINENAIVCQFSVNKKVYRAMQLERRMFYAPFASDVTDIQMFTATFQNVSAHTNLHRTFRNFII